MSPEEIMDRSDQWWEDRLAMEDGEGGMVVVVMAMAAVSGGIVGFVVGLLVG